MREVLRWGGMPHTFTLTEGKHSLVGTLKIVKKRGTQTMIVRFPKGISLQRVLDAWKQQGEQWIEGHKCQPDEKHFFALRVIDLQGYRIFWHIFHEYDVPYDSCRVLKTI